MCLLRPGQPDRPIRKPSSEARLMPACDSGVRASITPVDGVVASGVPYGEGALTIAVGPQPICLRSPAPYWRPIHWLAPKGILL